MNAARIYRMALSGWLRWRTKRRMYAAYPELRMIDAEQAKLKRRHKKHKHFDKAREAFVVSALGRVK